MSVRPNPDHAIAEWLREEADAGAPDRLLAATRRHLETTQQRRAWWPARRFNDMNAFTKLAVAAAVVVSVAVVGITLVPRREGVGGPLPSAPSPTHSPIALPLDPQQLTVAEPGTYLAGDPFQVPITMTIPAGWVGKVGGPYAVFLDPAPAGSRRAHIELTTSQTLYADPCHDRGVLAPPPGSTVDDFAAALARLPGFTTTSTSAINVDGYSGKELMLTAPASFENCTLTDDGYRLWQLPLGWVLAFEPGQSTTVRIIDVNGTRLAISSDIQPTTTAHDRAELQAILDSIRIEGRTPAGPGPTAAQP